MQEFAQTLLSFLTYKNKGRKGRREGGREGKREGGKREGRKSFKLGGKGKKHHHTLDISKIPLKLGEDYRKQTWTPEGGAAYMCKVQNITGGEAGSMLRPHPRDTGTQ